MLRLLAAAVALHSSNDAMGSSTAMSVQKLGAWSMQTGETSPVRWKNQTLLVVSMTGDTPGVYDCCKCGTFGCQTLANTTHIGAADCSACTCSAEKKAQLGSCAPEYFAIWDWETLEVLVSPIPGTEGFEFASAFVDDATDTLYVYGTNGVNHSAVPMPPDKRACGSGAGQLPCREFAQGRICNDTDILGKAGAKLDSVGACFDWCKQDAACKYFSLSLTATAPWCIRYTRCTLKSTDDPSYSTYEIDEAPSMSQTRRRIGTASRVGEGMVARAVSCFSTSDPTSSANWATSTDVLLMPGGYDVFNTDVAPVVHDPSAPDRKFIMVMETNRLAGTGTSWLTLFAETSSLTADRGWRLIDPLAHHVTLERMTACPAVRFFDGYYYVVTTTETPQGEICPVAGHSNYKGSTLCVIVYRSRTLKSTDWVLGNGKRPIVAPGDDDRRVIGQWTPTAAEREAIEDKNSSAPRVDGNINNSDYDFCDTPEGVLGVYAGISNQQSNPYFGEATLVANATSAEWLASLFQ